MLFYQDFSDVERAAFRRRVFWLLSLTGLFLLILSASYGVTLWLEVKGLWGANKLEITLSGEGQVGARPDVAKITVSILTQKTALKEASDENSRKSNAVADYVKKQGVSEKDIKTINYHIYPQQSYPEPCPRGLAGYENYVCPEGDRQPKIVGYQIRSAFEVTIRDISKAGDILGGVVGAGANEVSGITFDIDKPDELRAQARAEAIADARKKAERLAGDLGRKVGRIISFSESGAVPPIYFKETAALSRGGGVAAPSPAIEPGQTEITADVNITYEFK